MPIKKNEREETVTIRLPRIKDREAEYVSVNDRTWMVKRGVSVEVPVCVAEVLETSEDLEFEAAERRRGLQKT